MDIYVTRKGNQFTFATELVIGDLTQNISVTVSSEYEPRQLGFLRWFVGGGFVDELSSAIEPMSDKAMRAVIEHGKRDLFQQVLKHLNQMASAGKEAERLTATLTVKQLNVIG